MKKLILISGILSILVIIACSNVSKEKNTLSEKTSIKESEVITQQLSEEFKKYWYAGTAEISSYQLEQARYGEIREGKAVLIYVTEDFLPSVQVKADRQHPENIPVLKLNSTKNFVTGIYPYSIMQSTFYPVSDKKHAIKVSSSMQEWCGHVYTQLNNREQFEIQSHSYFEGEADQQLALEKSILENELWTKIRINPDNLPVGDLQIIPSLAYCRLTHKEIKAYAAKVQLQKDANISSYMIEYPALGRKININFTTDFPHEIESWTETFKSGYGTDAKELTTKGTKIKRIKSAYWGKKSSKDEILRKELGLN
ncbi:hypothetical protein GCM10022393_18530 [Aquimarina addita]|uniref:Septum formation inhibitor Maf n=1 Tax=Aquimarina addita TaxID=870485 RepID=A0ABP6UHC4_9FLAO